VHPHICLPAPHPMHIRDLYVHVGNLAYTTRPSPGLLAPRPGPLAKPPPPCTPYPGPLTSLLALCAPSRGSLPPPPDPISPALSTLPCPTSRRPLPHTGTSSLPDLDCLPAMTFELAMSLKKLGQTISQTSAALPVSSVNVKFSLYHGVVLRGLVTT
jgi:hypothetical protein